MLCISAKLYIIFLFMS